MHINITYGNLFFISISKICTRTEAPAEAFVKSLRLENQETVLVVTYQGKYDAISVGYLSQRMDAMTGNKTLQLKIL